MAYELSFSPEFFFAEGEPYDCTLDLDGLRNGIVKPVSVYQALCAMSDEDLIAAFEAISPPENRPAWSGALLDCGRPDELWLWDSIMETNMCSNLDTPVEVWIDPEGEYTIKVYDSII